MYSWKDIGIYTNPYYFWTGILLLFSFSSPKNPHQSITEIVILKKTVSALNLKAWRHWRLHRELRGCVQCWQAQCGVFYFFVFPAIIVAPTPLDSFLLCWRRVSLCPHLILSCGQDCCLGEGKADLGPCRLHPSAPAGSAGSAGRTQCDLLCPQIQPKPALSRAEGAFCPHAR